MNCPRSCSPTSEIIRQELDKWSSNIESMLNHSLGIEKFKEYLICENLEELHCVEFWQFACELENILNEIEQAEKSCLTTSRYISEYKDCCESLLCVARENVNFDSMELKELLTIRNNFKCCKAVLPRAKASILYMLKSSMAYQEFLKQLFSKFRT